MTALRPRLETLLRRYREAIKNVLAFLPGFLTAAAVMVIAQLIGYLVRNGPSVMLSTAIVLPVLCGVISLVVLRRKSRKVDLAETYDQVLRARQYAWVALMGLILGAFLFSLLMFLVAEIFH